MILSFINICKVPREVLKTSLGTLRMLMNGKSCLIPVLRSILVASRPKYLVCMVSLHSQRYFKTHLHSLPGVAELKLDVMDPIILYQCLSLHISPHQCWFVVLVFYGSSTHFRSFRARSFNLATPGQFTSI